MHTRANTETAAPLCGPTWRGRATIAACGCLVALAGCASKISYLPAGTTYGEITVGKPRVSTRERLINDRLDEDAWLRIQLADTDSLQFGTQGATDIRSFSGTFAKAGVSTDSSAIALYRERQAQALADGRRQDALRDIDQQIALARKQKELADVLAGTAPAAAASAPAAAQPQTNTPPVPNANFQTQMEGVANAIGQLGQKINSLTGRGTETVPTLTSANASPIDTFRDRLAYREEVRSEMIRNALDDAHDLGTNTLYRFSFDTTLFPGDDTSAWAVVGVEVDLPKGMHGDSIEAALPPGHIRLGRFLRIVNGRIAEEATDYGQQVLRECRDASSFRCLGELRPESLLRLYDFARSVDLPLTSNAAPSASRSKAAADVTAALGTKQSGLTEFSQVLRFAPAYRSTPAMSGATQFLAREQMEALWNKLALLGDWSGSGAPSLEAAAAGTYRAVARALSASLAGEGDTLLVDAACRLNPRKRLHGFRVDGDAGKVMIDESARDLAVVTMMREQSGPEEYAASARWHEAPCSGKGFIAAHRQRILQELDTFRTGHVFAYAATPKETVQRVSEVLSRRNASEFALALQAITGSASVDAMFSHMRANDALFHALRRQPLVVGFSGSFAPKAGNEPARFGWVFGPRYEIRYAGNESAVPLLSGFWNSTSQAAGFRHTLVQNNVSAVISVPAAYEKVMLRLTRCWRKSETEWVVGSTGQACAEPGKQAEQMEVSLPLDERRVFRLEGLPFATERQVIVAANSPWKYEVRVDEPATLVIRGDHLWRNTKVLLGAQEADSVQVLPDMRGILVRFNKVRPPTESGLRSDDMDLKIVTSEQTVLAGRVIVRDVPAVSNGPAWSVKGTRVVVAGNPVVIAAEGRLPAAYASIDLRLSNLALREAEPVETGDRTVDDGERVVAFATAKDKFAKWRNGDMVKAEVVTRRLPNDPAPQVRVLDALVHYKTDDDASVAFKKADVSDTSARLTLSFPPKFRQAYPVLAKETSIPLVYEWTKDNLPRSAEGNCVLAGQADKCVVTLNVPKATEGTLRIGRGAKEGYPAARQE